MKKKFLSLCCATALASAMLSSAAMAIENPFSDVSSDSTLAQAVMWAYDNDITKGATDTEFKPTDTCTRGQVVTFLWRSQGQPIPTTTENPFTDVTTDDYYYNAVLWAMENGITGGTTDTTFSPAKTCTTAEVLTFLYRANGEPDKTDEGAYYQDAVNWATANGLATSVEPSSESPRADIVTYLWKNEGSPAMEVTDPEPVVYTYNYPEYTVPSSELEVSWEYFAEIFTYLALSGEEKFTVTATGYTYDELNNDDYKTARVDGYNYARYQHTDIAQLYKGYSSSYTSGNNAKITFRLTYSSSLYSSLSEVAADKEVFLSMVSDLVTGFYDSGALKETDSEMVVARYLYEWVCDHVTYGSDNTPNKSNAYFTLIYGEGHCMGYAGLLNALYRTAGIECYGVDCSTDDGEHAMNYAKLDGTWYYIDATFGDTGQNHDKYFAMSRSTVDGIYTLDSVWAD